MVILPSLSRAAATYNTDIRLPADAKGVIIVVDVTVSGASGTLDVKLQGYNQAKDAYFDLFDRTATTPVVLAIAQFGAGATGTKSIAVHNLAPVVAVSATTPKQFSAPLPRAFRAVSTVAVGAVTFSVAGIPLP
jgi:hypothetical protein